MKEDIHLFKRVMLIIKPFYRQLIITFLLLITSTITGLFAPYFFGKTIDFVTAKDFTNAYLFTGFTVMTWILYEVIRFFWNRYQIKYANLVIYRHLIIWSLEKMFGLSLGQFRGENSAYRQKIFDKGQSAMSRLMNSLLYSVLPILLSSLVTCIAIFTINLYLGIVVFSTLLLYIFVIVKVNRYFEKDLKYNQELWAQEGREFSENLRYLGLIKSNSQEGKALEQYKKVFNKAADFDIPLWVKFSLFGHLREGVIIMSRAVVLFIGIWLTVQGNLTVGSLVILFSWSSTAFNGITRIGNFHRQVINNIAEIKKLFEIIDEPADVQELANPVVNKNIKGAIEFKNVTFAYPKRKKGDDEDEIDNVEKSIENEKDEPVLHDVSFEIEAGKTTAFVGRSGSGKTTMINLLLRAYDPQEGDILIDGENLKNLDMDTYRKQVGVVEQEVEVFDKTIKHNVLFPIDHPEKITDKNMLSIAKDSGMDEFEDRLTHGFETKIGEKGIQLSGGQKQRVGIARVLAKKPAILIFDEATSNLDSVNEKNIHAAMNKALKGRTGIIIAHRLATIIDADKIIVMDNGKVVGQGTHKELLKSCKEYQELVKLQNLD